MKLKWSPYMVTHRENTSHRKWTIFLGNPAADRDKCRELRMYGLGERCSFYIGMTKIQAIKLCELLNGG